MDVRVQRQQHPQKAGVACCIGAAVSHTTREPQPPELGQVLYMWIKNENKGRQQTYVSACYPQTTATFKGGGRLSDRKSFVLLKT